MSARFHLRTALSATAALALLALSACSSGGSEYETFTEALEDGASCQELFDMRNEFEAGASYVEDANEALREIGCYSTSSTRTDN